MRNWLKPDQGVKAYRKATVALAGSTLLIGGGVQAQDVAAQQPPGQQASDGQGGEAALRPRIAPPIRSA